jgi:hypothetical protein
MKNQFLLIIVSTTFAISPFANGTQQKLINAAIDIKGIGQIISQKAKEEIAVIGQPYYCRTQNQGFGPYEGRGRSLEEAKASALKKCSIYCSTDQRLTCDTEMKTSEPSQPVHRPNPHIYVEIERLNQLVQSLTKQLSEVSEARNQWKAYSERLQISVSDLTARLQALENPPPFVDLTEACRTTFLEDNHHKNLCVKSGAAADLVQACSSMNTNYYKLLCINSNSSPTKVQACMGLTEDNHYRLQCIRTN